MSVGTSSLLVMDEDDDMSNVCHVAQVQKRGGDENAPKKNPVSFSHS